MALSDPTPHCAYKHMDTTPKLRRKCSHSKLPRSLFVRFNICILYRFGVGANLFPLGMKIQFLQSSCQRGQSSPGATVTNWEALAANPRAGAVQLPVVERQSTAEKCLTHLLYGIAQDVKAQDLSQKCAT